MKTDFSSLTICGLEELAGHGERGITHVLSILDPDTPDPTVFGGWTAHRRTVLRFHDVILPEAGLILPARTHVEEVLAFGQQFDEEIGDPLLHLLVHCHMGISRSSAAMTMLLAQAHPENDEAAIAEQVRTLRPIAWPNLRMIEHADALLDRRGRLVAAVGGIYAKSLAARPDLADTMTRANRGEEVELGRRHAS